MQLQNVNREISKSFNLPQPIMSFTTPPLIPLSVWVIYRFQGKIAWIKWVLFICLLNFLIGKCKRHNLNDINLTKLVYTTWEKTSESLKRLRQRGSIGRWWCLTLFFATLLLLSWKLKHSLKKKTQQNKAIDFEIEVGTCLTLLLVMDSMQSISAFLMKIENRFKKLSWPTLVP